MHFTGFQTDVVPFLAASDIMLLPSKSEGMPGVLIEDTHLLDLPPDLPAGKYQLVVGLYTATDGARLPLVDGRDSLVIGQIEIR